LQEGAHAITLLDRVAFLEEGIAKQTSEMAVVANERFILESVSFELVQRNFLESTEIRVGARVEVQMGLGMIAY